MAIANARFLLKLGQLASDTIILNTRCIALGSVKNLSTAAVDEQKKPPNLETTPPMPESKTNEDIEKLNKEITSLNEKNTELLDKYKRSLADSENLRSRLMKQIGDAKIFGIQSFCKDLLDVADVLSKATESVPKEEISDKNPHLKNLYEGLMMTEAQLKAVFKRHGLEPVDPLNEKFDPNYHEALFQQEVEGKVPGSVVVVSKIGYKLHDRVIRPALVGVSK
ncbi:hypothetical protein RN001_005895 [Aquatica leii]|uniref:GrpE protein homolog n=1 Tax=Aquatica leii TaxID=1421715 RepID=A0AAN7PKH3_9COLE|nr:hypothetical protein RN001_005895 [Aquatica leii]